MVDSIRVRANLPAPKLRVRVLPSLLPLQVEFQSDDVHIQWRYVGYDWTDLLAISEIATSVTIGSTTTLAAGSSATVANVGTAQDPILNFGIPRGYDGLVTSIVAGTGIQVNSADPAHPIVAASANLQTYNSVIPSASGLSLLTADPGSINGLTRVRVVTTSNITIATALNNGDTIDGVVLATNDLVLVAGQTAPAENGIYVVSASPARLTAFNTYDSHPGAYFSVMEGTANADTLWRCTSNQGGTINVTALVFGQFLVDATTSVKGVVQLATSAQVKAPPVGSKLVPTIPDLYFPTGHLWGLGLANGTDAVNDIDIAAGECRDSTGTVNLVLGSILTKQLDAAWAVGSNAGGLDQGSIANATYHMHLIERPDTGVVDAIYSLSHDRRMTATMTIASPGVVTAGVAGNGHGLVAGSPIKWETSGALPTGVTAGTQYYVIAAGLTETTFQFSTSNGGAAVNTSGSQSGVHTLVPGPQLPANYTVFRRIGSIIRSGATILAFYQDGDRFTFLVPVADISASNPGTSAVTRALSVPIGIIVDADIVANIQVNSAAAANSAGLITSLTQTDTAPTTTGAFTVVGNKVANGFSSAPVRVKTNAGGQIRSRLSASDTNTALYIMTNGWWDNRGRLA
jgi:hypothetical protein